MTRRILHEIKLDKIAAVDSPCQQPARVVIMKRLAPEHAAILKSIEDTPGAKTFAALFTEGEARRREWAAMDDLYPAMDAVSSSIRSIIADPNLTPESKQSMIRTSVEDFLAVVKEKAPEIEADIIEKLKTAGSGPHSEKEYPMPNEIKKALGLADTATDAEVAAAIAKNATDLATVQASVATITKVAALTDAQKAHYADLEKADKAKAQAFLDMKAEDKDAEVKKASAGDETVEIDGRTISKRVVGEDQFAVFKSMAKRLSDSEAEIKKAREETETATFTKRAEVEFPHLAGTVDDRTLVLKHLAKADEPTRKAADAILKAAEATSKLAFEKLGHNNSGNDGNGDGTEAEGKIAKRQAEILKAEPALSKAQAYSKALREDPSLYAELSDDDA